MQRKVSHKIEELLEILEGASNGTAWAIKIVDANGHYSGGLFWGNGFMMGSQSQCTSLEMARAQGHPLAMVSIDEKYDFRKTHENRTIFDRDPLSVLSIPTISIAFFVVELKVQNNAYCQLLNTQETTLRIGLCLPRSCRAPDIHTALEWAVQESSLMKVINVKILRQDYSLFEDQRTYIIGPIFCVMALLMLTGTLLDIFVTDKISNSFWYRLLNSFSVITNTKIICSLQVGDDTLAPIHGLKFISMLWVVMVHTCLLLFQIAGNRKFRDNAETDFLFQTVSNGTFSVDTFFALSGVLVSFLFFRTIAKYSVKKLIGISGFLGRLLLYISMLGFRLVRLSVPYMIMVVLAGLQMERQTHVAPLQVPNQDHINCARYWWRNALFINTFYPGGEMCMMWSWYLANDTQFYVLGVPILLIALKYRLLALVLGSVCLVASWITTAVLSLYTEHTIDIRDPFANYDDLYDKPWTRMGPYLVGMATGWLLFRLNCQLTIPRRVNVLLWTISLNVMLFIVYGPMFFPLEPVSGAIYTSLAHTLWCVCVCWVLVACVTGNGGWIDGILSWKYMYPLSRLSYCAYLVHPLVMREVVLSSDSPFHISVEIMMVLFLGFLCMTMAAAAIVSLAFEAPMVALLRLGNPMRRSKQ
ncbi:uncharacterized protein CBL_12579 [Carabus blaptoides fortunei]